MVEKYIRLYHKRNIQLALFCAVIVFIPLFLAALFSDATEYDVYIAFCPFPIAAVCVAISSLTVLRFRRMIQAQEARYRIVFRDDEAVCLETTLYLSKDWLISAGSSALYREHIQSVRSSVRRGRSGSSNRVVVQTVDGRRYVLWCTSSTSVRKIKKWKNG